MMKKFFLLPLLVLFACHNGPDPKPTPPTPTDAAYCGEACEHMQFLGCKEGDDVPGPDNTVVGCEQFCVKTLNENNVELNPSCIVNITSCSQIETVCAIGKRR